MNQIKSPRDWRVELLRVIACFMVIIIHIRLYPFSGTTLRDSVILMYVLSGPSVAIFFLISGFFFRGTQSILHIWKRFLTSVICPAMVLIMALSFLRPWIAQPEISLLQSMRMAHPLQDFLSMLRGFLCLDVVSFGSYAEHLWYILSYGTMMLWVPIIIGLLRAHEERILLLLMGFAFLHFTLDNLNGLYPLPIALYRPECIGKPTMYAIAGCFLYRHVTVRRSTLDRSVEARERYACLLLELLLSIALFFLQKQLYVKGLQMGQDIAALNANYYYTSWSGMLCGLQAIAISAFILMLPEIPAWAAQTIRTLGSLTFPIYLIHFIFTNHFRALGIEQAAQQLFGGSFVGIVLYTLCYAALIFALCALMILAWRQMKQRLLKRMKRNLSTGN
ncbi:MAG: acyltransferase family protein [Lachnospiraceae bacterium]|nr:acyltransferase family protein [Lachnospiraceae bacterium]